MASCESIADFADFWVTEHSSSRKRNEDRICKTSEMKLNLIKSDNPGWISINFPKIFRWFWQATSISAFLPEWLAIAPGGKFNMVGENGLLANSPQSFSWSPVSSHKIALQTNLAAMITPRFWLEISSPIRHDRAYAIHLAKAFSRHTSKPALWQSITCQNQVDKGITGASLVTRECIDPWRPPQPRW